ncbi:uncharacterized protein LOC114963619 [Acropora millepora]|uniref:uncharacterized protein LOC114963619 n=1 Tax=Acropora millepora TaxID=45264 RepID=UPI001CF27752|nr:uncharacterized protein LOC114963619 [Acropora millepora]
MDDPTIAEVAAAFKNLTNLKSGFLRVTREAELNKVRKAIQDARMKTASTPWAFIMSVNMNGSASNRGTAVDRRTLLTIIMRSFFSSLIFCQELPGCFEKEVVDKCGIGGYEYVATDKEASVLWLAEEFNGEPVKTTDSSIDKILKELTKQGSDVDMSELRGRMALVKLTKKGKEASSCRPFLAVSWHGPYKGKIVARKKVVEGLIHFLREVCKKEKVSSFIIGGDFNMDTLNDIDLEENVVVPSYNLTSRAESKSKEGTNYIPYKDNFIFLNKRDRDIWVSSVRPIEFENSTDFGSDISKEDHQKFNEHKQSQDTVERKDLLDHDPIVGVLILTNKRTGECKVEIMHDFLFSTSDGLVSPPVNLKYHLICLQSFKVVSFMQ